MQKLCPFGKQVKHRLIDLEKPDNWLINEVKKDTNLYFDTSYYAKILSGVRRPSKIMDSMCKILNIKND